MAYQKIEMLEAIGFEQIINTDKYRSPEWAANVSIINGILHVETDENADANLITNEILKRLNEYNENNPA